MPADEKWLRTFLAAAGAFCLMVGSLVYLFYGNTAVSQSRRLSRVRQYKEFMQPQLSSDPRFKSVKLGVTLFSGGASLFVQGTLVDSADFGALKTWITSTTPPENVDYRGVVVLKP